MKIQLLITALMLGACAPKTETSPGSFAPADHVSEGHEQGNGTDNPPIDADSAWFLGTDAIQYCYSIAPDFGVPRDQIEADLKSAFLLWKEYIANKNVNRLLREKFIASEIASFSEPLKTERRQNAERVAHLLQLATESQLRSSCDGQEDVTFYFGVKTPEVKQGLKKYYDPTAFAMRTSYDPSTGRGKGFVWISNGLKNQSHVHLDWRLPYRLRGILTHEIGHIYGIGHVEDTIMREDMTVGFGDPAWTSRSQDEVEYELTHIDGRRELIATPRENIASDLVGIKEMNTSSVERQFLIFGGRKPVGETSLRLEGNDLELIDDQGTLRIPITIEKASLTRYSNGRAFRLWRTWTPVSEQSLAGSSVELSSESGTYIGHALDYRGQLVPLQIHINASGSPLTISYFFENSRYRLFQAQSAQ